MIFRLNKEETTFNICTSMKQSGKSRRYLLYLIRLRVYLKYKLRETKCRGTTDSHYEFLTLMVSKSLILW